MHDVTVVIPCFNAGSFLADAVQSAQMQSGDGFRVAEIVVVDDRSDDPLTLKTLRSLKEPARVVTNGRERGPGGARNFGASVSTSKYLTFLDSDDILPPGSLACRFAALQMAQGPAFVGADFTLWWGSDRFEDDGFFRTRERPSRLLKEAFANNSPIRLPRPYVAFLEATLCHCGTVLMERELFSETGGFDESLRFCEDHLFFIRLATRADYIFVPTVAMWYRQHENSITSGLISGEFCPTEKYSRALRRWLEVEPGAPTHELVRRRIQSLEVESARWYRLHERYREAMQASRRALAIDFTSRPAWRELVAGVVRR
ncbi:MAG TPA: glycosyltransferase [Aquabacterium sp.]|nr:glycosyltransferase [Aquabacterium sp.]